MWTASTSYQEMGQKSLQKSIDEIQTWIRSWDNGGQEQEEEMYMFYV